LSDFELDELAADDPVGLRGRPFGDGECLGAPSIDMAKLDNPEGIQDEAKSRRVWAATSEASFVLGWALLGPVEAAEDEAKLHSD